MSTQALRTRHVTDGSMWIQDDDWGDDQPERFLVKWRDHSFLHCSWEHEFDLRSQVGASATTAAIAALARRPDAAGAGVDPRAYFDAAAELAVAAASAPRAPPRADDGGEAGGDAARVAVRWAGGDETEESVADLKAGGVDFEAAAAPADDAAAAPAADEAAAPADEVAAAPAEDVAAPAEDDVAAPAEDDAAEDDAAVPPLPPAP